MFSNLIIHWVKKKIKIKNVKKNTTISSFNIAMYKMKGNIKLTGKNL